MEIPEDNINYLLKIILIRDSGAAKINLLSRYTSNEFQIETMNTIGVDFKSMDVKRKGKYIKI